MIVTKCNSFFPLVEKIGFEYEAHKDEFFYMESNMKNSLEISVHNFRAIKSADIRLNGITVLAGVNGSGKSTISKLVYWIIKTIRDYEGLVLTSLTHDLMPYRNALLDFYSEMGFYDEDSMSLWRTLRNVFRPKSLNDVSKIEEVVSKVCDRLDEYSHQVVEPKKLDRFRRIILSTMELESDVSLQEALAHIQKRIHQMISDAEETIARRPSSVINDRLSLLFGSNLVRNVELNEYGVSLFGRSVSISPLIHFVTNVFYIDTPFIIDFEDSEVEHWAELEDSVRIQSSAVSDFGLSRFIGSSVIHGDATVKKIDQYQKDVLFKDSHGNEFNLAQGATGIKSFALIQLLLRNGLIQKGTVLILDEPEAHLHPQWIIEYARLIVLMHKTMGVNFLISSHSTDMVSAIRYLAEKEGAMDSLEFYCSKNAQDGTGRFNFRSIGHNIEPIFASFNKSYRVLDKYMGNGEKEE